MKLHVKKQIQKEKALAYNTFAFNCR